MNRAIYEQKHEKALWEQQNLYESLTDYIEAHLEEELF